MSKLDDKLIKTQKCAMPIQPKVGGFPILAEVLRQAICYGAGGEKYASHSALQNLWFPKF